MTEPRRAVFDVNVLVGAVVGGNSTFASWPAPPPVSDNAYADCVGIANDAKEFALFLSEHVLRNVARVLVEGFQWEARRVEEYLDVLVEISEASGGDVLEPAVAVSDAADHEDNRILELALAGNADLIVSDDSDLTSLSPWRGIPILTPREFAGRVDAARRATARASRKGRNR